MSMPARSTSLTVNVDYTKVHDEVQAIDPINMTVTLDSSTALASAARCGTSRWTPSIPLAAAIEHNTYAPLMGKLLLGNDDSAGSPIERIFIATNGTEGIAIILSVKDSRLDLTMDTGRTIL